MGLLDGLLKGAFGGSAAEAGKGNAIIDIALGMINNPGSGGISGLIQTFKDKGLGDLMDSWISTGQNKPVSGEQMQDVVGKEKIREIAEKLNVSSTEASKGLADALPQIIDKLTPDGKLPEGDLLSKGISLLKGTLFGN